MPQKRHVTVGMDWTDTVVVTPVKFSEQSSQRVIKHSGNLGSQLNLNQSMFFLQGVYIYGS